MEMDNVFGPEPDQTNANDFGFIDFMDESNFEQFIELIRGENAEPALKFCPNYDCEHISGCLLEESAQIFGTTSSSSPQPPQPPPPDTGGLFDFNIVNNKNNDDDEINNNNNNDTEYGGGGDSPLSAKLLLRGALGLEENEGDRESSATTTTATIPVKMRITKTDRSKTLISERKRRGRMKEKLYALRSLVPNITKMDKASIIGDAVLYIQDLQTHAKKLKAEILNLETSFTNHPAAEHDDFQEKFNQNYTNGKKLFKITAPVIKKILQMEVFQLEEREFYGRIVCNKEQGIAGLLYKALESLTSFRIHSTNLAALADNYVLTFTLHVEEVMEMEIMNLANLKLWIASVFLNLGFDFLELPQV